MNEKINNQSYYWERKPKEQKYIPCNFETVGKCPRCGEKVKSSIGHTDATCKKCGLELCWN